MKKVCEFCHKHGEGQKWYLRAENYAEDLLSDLRRRNYIHNFFTHPEKLGQSMEKLDYLNKVPPFVRSVVSPFIVYRQKKVHYGQVVPIEDLEKILGFVNSVIRLPCICRQVTVGSEQRYCYGVSMAPPGESRIGEIIHSMGAEYLTGPDTSGLEDVSKEEALSQMRELEKTGQCHTVWTFLTPFIAGICNCDQDCMSIKSTVNHQVPVMFRSEYVAEVNVDLCSGCRKCMQVCQYGAMGYSLAHKKVVIDPRRCYGCGICRASCAKDAITLNDRAAVPQAATIW
jgi:ferredoxin